LRTSYDRPSHPVNAFIRPAVRRKFASICLGGSSANVFNPRNRAQFAGDQFNLESLSKSVT
jgi:hypothetical protein